MNRKLEVIESYKLHTKVMMISTKQLGYLTECTVDRSHNIMFKFTPIEPAKNGSMAEPSLVTGTAIAKGVKTRIALPLYLLGRTMHVRYASPKRPVMLQALSYDIHGHLKCWIQERGTHSDNTPHGLAIIDLSMLTGKILDKNTPRTIASMPSSTPIDHPITIRLDANDLHVFKLDTAVTHIITGHEGYLTHIHVNYNGTIEYCFCRSGDPDMVSRSVFAEDIVGGEWVKVRLPIECLNTKVTHTHHHNITGIVRRIAVHHNGCLHVDLATDKVNDDGSLSPCKDISMLNLRGTKINSDTITNMIAVPKETRKSRSVGNGSPLPYVDAAIRPV